MAFEENTPTTQARTRYAGAGFRQEPDFREGTATFQAVAEPAALTTASAESEPTVTLPKRAAPNLSYVFDDPADGEPGRDRMLVHGLWELVLAVALGATAYLLHRQQPDVFAGAGLRVLLLQVSVFGLIAAAAAVALRAGVVNLAVGPIWVAASIWFAAHSGGGLLQPLLIVVALSAAVGLVHGLVLAGLHVPAWAASLGTSLALLIWIQHHSADQSAAIYSAKPDAYWWLAGFCGLSVVFGAAGLLPAVRRGFGRYRPVSDPADRRGWVAGAIAVVATVGSSVLAGVSGALGASVLPATSATDGVVLTATAVGIALLGGTSAFGRRGGLFGTVLASGLFVAAGAYAALTHPTWSAAALVAAVVIVGLVVTRMVERFGRPSLGDGGDDAESNEWLLRTHSTSTAAPASSWSAGKPAATQTTAGGLWSSDDAWGTAENR